MTSASQVVWARVASELDAQGKTISWLASELGCDIQRVFNWKTRGVPARAYSEIAGALGISIGELLGVVDEKSGDISAMARSIAVEFDRIVDPDKRLKVYTHMVGVLALVNGPAIIAKEKK